MPWPALCDLVWEGVVSVGGSGGVGGCGGVGGWWWCG